MFTELGDASKIRRSCLGEHRGIELTDPGRGGTEVPIVLHFESRTACLLPTWVLDLERVHFCW